MVLDLTLRLREHQANCRHHKQHSAVVAHSATEHSWGFTCEIVVNTQQNTSKSKIAEALCNIKNMRLSRFELAFVHCESGALIH